ncbi:hypothetical protein CLOM_g9342 [Closterium sp. NIES-68]|nr:hypothetical protein CLOM_g21010 [Closterium sp. NIES-68]GJP50197.1 hypothetical protein CLOM_g9342 [Closterium sp. NIES-68]GJP60808.1 hypothetical protein CLOP_g18026 [Closterium sp. NIES-67]
MDRKFEFRIKALAVVATVAAGIATMYADYGDRRTVLDDLQGASEGVRRWFLRPTREEEEEIRRRLGGEEKK